MADRIVPLLADIRACRLCEAYLPLGPRPVLQASATSRLLIVSQAPGRKVHLSGVPFDDVSGQRLREWLGIERDTFYDAARVAIVPMGFCFPGSGRGGDLPPRPECAPAWHPRLLPLLTQVRLTLVIGQYAQVGLLGTARAASLTDTVRAWRTARASPTPCRHGATISPTAACRCRIPAHAIGCGWCATRGSRPNCCRCCANAWPRRCMQRTERASQRALPPACRFI